MIAFSKTIVYAEYHYVADCTVCHDVRGETSNLKFILEVITTPVIFTARTGDNSFADGDDTYDGVCEVCHTTTLHHRNDGSDGTAHHDGEDCTTCHLHRDEFSAPIQVCEGDFNHDGDVDGSDLAVFAGVGNITLEVFAADFGRTDCPH